MDVCLDSLMKCDVRLGLGLGGKHYIVRSKNMFYVDRDSWMGYPHDETAKVWFDYSEGCYYGSLCRSCAGSRDGEVHDVCNLW